MIRLLSPSDSDQLASLRRQSLATDPHAFVSTSIHEENYSADYYRNRIVFNTHPPSGFYGFFESDTLLAYVYFARDNLPKITHLANLFELYVLPEHRHQGIAAKLLTHLIELATNHPQIEQLHLRTNSTNTAAINLYKKLGFTHIGTRKHAIKEDTQIYQDELLFCLYL